MLDPAPVTEDVVDESARHALEQRRKYAPWLDAHDAVVVANAMLIIIGNEAETRAELIDPALKGVRPCRRVKQPGRVQRGSDDKQTQNEQEQPKIRILIKYTHDKQV